MSPSMRKIGVLSGALALLIPAVLLHAVTGFCSPRFSVVRALKTAAEIYQPDHVRLPLELEMEVFHDRVAHVRGHIMHS
jgi:hypothetical protein